MRARSPLLHASTDEKIDVSLHLNPFGDAALILNATGGNKQRYGAIRAGILLHRTMQKSPYNLSFSASRLIMRRLSGS